MPKDVVILVVMFLLLWLLLKKTQQGVELKGLINSFFEWFGELGFFSGQVVRAAFTRPYEGRELIRQFDEVGAKSLPLVALAGAATGIVLCMQTRDSLVRFGAEGALPAVVVFSLIKETGPIVTALVLSGRLGAGIGAELGSMKVTEQIDAMEVSAVNPYRYLAATRVLACTLMLPLLTLVANFAGIMSGWVASTLADPISLHLFLVNGFQRMTFSDYFQDRRVRSDHRHDRLL